MQSNEKEADIAALLSKGESSDRTKPRLLKLHSKHWHELLPRLTEYAKLIRVRFQATGKTSVARYVDSKYFDTSCSH